MPHRRKGTSPCCSAFARSPFKRRARTAAKIGGRPAGFRRAPLFTRQPAYKPGSGRHANDTRMRDGHSSGTPVTRRLKQPTRTAGSGHHPEAVLAHGFAPSLFGLAPGGVCHAAAVTVGAVRSYRTFSPLPQLNQSRGGTFSVALSLDSHPPDVIRHHLSAEPGLSSPAAFRLRRSGRPTD
jgi:hypothetical protein